MSRVVVLLYNLDFCLLFVVAVGAITVQVWRVQHAEALSDSAAK
jgi:hypothetical protein